MILWGLWIIGNAVSCQQIVSRALLEDVGRLQRAQRQERAGGNRAQRRGNKKGRRR